MLNHFVPAVCYLTGLVLLSVVFYKEIAARKKALGARQESEERFRLFFESSAAAIGITSPTGTYLQVNSTACRLLGYTEDELLGLNVLDVTHPDDREMVQRQFAELLSGTRQVIDYEKRYLHKNGKVLWGHATASCLRDGTGRLQYVAGQVVDISGRKQAEAALLAANRQLQGIIDFLPDATLVIDGEKRVIAWNRAMEEKTGVAKEEILGQGDFAYALALYGKRKPILIDMIGEPELMAEADYDFIEKRGETLVAERFLPTLYRGRGGYMWMKASPLLDQAGRLVGAIESIRDISERKQADEELRRANRELDAFANTVSHDLRSPLTPIIGYADHLAEHYQEQLDAAALQALGQISSSGNKMLATMNDLLQLAKVGVVEPPPDPIDLRDVVERVAEGLAGQLASAGAQLSIQALPCVPLPESLLYQLFDNLIRNAIVHGCRQGGVIEVAGERSGDRVRLSVCDHGPGIPEADRQRVFEVFYRGAAAQGREGTGIGLATVKKIAKLFEGRVWIEETPGGGSTFRVELQDRQVLDDQLAS